MATFKDTQGREWTIRIDPFLIEDAREEDPLFLKGDPSETLQRLDNDPALLCGVAWLACKEQAVALGIDQKAFYFGICGDGIESIAKALTAAIASFIPPLQREVFVLGAAKNEKVREIAHDRAMALLNDPNLMAQATALIDEKVDEILTPLRNAGSTQASSESTQKG
jgi:hypothetical protein